MSDVQKRQETRLSPEVRAMMSFLEWIATNFPVLAKYVEKYIRSLKTRPKSAGQILEQHLRSAEATGVSRSSDWAHNEAAPESGPHRTPQPSAPRPEEPPSTSGDTTSKASHHLMLEQIKALFEDNRTQDQTELRTASRQEGVVFWAYLALALVSVALILGASYLLFTGGPSVVSALGQLMGLLTGAGSFFLKSLRKHLNTKVAALRKSRDELSDFLRVIQVTLSLPVTERDQAIRELAQQLRQGLGNRTN